MNLCLLFDQDEILISKVKEIKEMYDEININIQLCTFKIKNHASENLLFHSRVIGFFKIKDVKMSQIKRNYSVQGRGERSKAFLLVNQRFAVFDWLTV